MNEVYVRLAAHFDKHHNDPRGLDYLTGEQVVSRLNEVLGPGGWSFVVKEHGYEEAADEMWALGHLEATVDGVPVVREQFGSQKHNRRRADQQILDHGFDLKGAATDALKKCATLIGVGLYLAEKDGGIPQQQEDTGPAPKANSTSRERPHSASAGRPPLATLPTPHNDLAPFVPLREREVVDTRPASELLLCEECSHPIEQQAGGFINAQQADLIRERYGRLICREHRPVKAMA